MEEEFADVQHKASKVDAVEGAIASLKSQGLLKQTGEFNYEAVSSWEEKK